MKPGTNRGILAAICMAGLAGSLWFAERAVRDRPDAGDASRSRSSYAAPVAAAAVLAGSPADSARPADERKRPHSIESINDLRFTAALDSRPALSAESKLLASGMIDIASAKNALDRRNFDSLLDAMDKDMRTDPFSLEIAQMFEGALSESFAEAGFAIERLACGRSVCAGSAVSEGDRASWSSATGAFDRMYGTTYSSLVSSHRYVNGRVMHDFLISTNPAESAVFFPRMPSTGINFGPAPEPARIPPLSGG